MTRLTKKERIARDRLVDAATEVAAICGGRPDPGQPIGEELSHWLGVLWRANDAWQEALMRGEET
jgi:hypothetical protein